MQTARRDFNKTSHRPVDSISETKPLRFQVIKTLANQGGIGRQPSRCFTDHPVALLEAVYTAANFGNRSGKFVSEDDRVIHLPTLVTQILMEIASTDGDRL